MMGFVGQTYSIPCDRGGLNGNYNIDLVPPEAMIAPSRNINLHRGGREKRGGTAHVNTTALSGTPQVNSVFDYWQKDGTRYVMLGSNDGKIWKNFIDTIKTGWASSKKAAFEVFDNKLYVCNGSNTPFYWDGTTLTDMTSIPSDWTGTNFPSQFIKHGFGNSERLWAIGCLGTATTAYRIYASKNGDATDFSDANVVTLELNTADYGGIVGAVEYGDRLILFSSRHSFIIDDTDASVANWGYQSSIWEGGAAHQRLIVRTPNDIICMMEDGEIYSIMAAENYGDYKQASLTRPSFIHNWIKDNVKLSEIDSFHAVYDPVMRAIKIFVMRNGQTQIDTALVYFTDRDPKEAWGVHDNQSYDSGYSACSSGVVRVSAGDYRVYTGDYDGFVWNMETTNRNDNNNGYYAGFKTAPLPLENPRVKKRFKEGRVVITPQGSFDLSYKWWVDGTYQGTGTISQAGAGTVLGTFVLDTDSLRGGELLDSSFVLGNLGKRIQLEIYNTNANQSFFVSQLMIDFVPLGAMP